ncbi:MULTISPECIES: hypothetical protein [Mesorhizobium]|uniref:hypothetical protein n=1 Tax=Mesorhizobium sp. TaxID=1871066 RepID=UPI000493CC48|nr:MULTISPECIES: hypothetical protein [Mesorhizobium]RWM69193.1 MAG: hypothetical protein EOR82_23445 [Mesorhizobium sp.]TIO21140.1 MAG: hypothetical protein E5X83_30855 [Mesorhizobium sp.]TJV54773.1 MAG: hypothetical protein E5X82_30010 [Mesorhizobium sp.]
MQQLYSNLVTHYEKAVSFQDRAVEHERRCGHLLPESEALLEILAENLTEARRALDRVTHGHYELTDQAAVWKPKEVLPRRDYSLD